MNKARAEQRLRELGFEIDWSVTGRAEGYWSGTIDAIGRTSISGDCFGLTVTGDTAADWYDNAVQEAESHANSLRPCEHPPGACEFHDPWSAPP